MWFDWLWLDRFAAGVRFNVMVCEVVGIGGCRGDMMEGFVGRKTLIN